MSSWLQQTRQRLARRLQAMADEFAYAIGTAERADVEAMRNRVRHNQEQYSRRDRALLEWRERLKQGAVINLMEDQRVHLFVNEAVTAMIPLPCYVLLPSVRAWCSATLADEVREVPLHSTLPIGAIWFADPLDAVAFKIRWY